MKSIERAELERYYKRIHHPLLRRFLVETENPARKEIDEFPVLSDLLDWDYLYDYIKPRFDPISVVETLAARGKVKVISELVKYSGYMYYLDEITERATRAVMYCEYLMGHEKLTNMLIPVTFAAIGDHAIAKAINLDDVRRVPSKEELGEMFNQPWIGSSELSNQARFQAESVDLSQVEKWIRQNGESDDFDPNILTTLARINLINNALVGGKPLTLRQIGKVKVGDKPKTGALKLARHYLANYPELENLALLYEDVLARAKVRPRRLTGI